MIRMTTQSRPKTKITIGLCVKNSEKTVKEAINSIINQRYPKELMEIIVVDGGSEDNTLSIVTDMISNADMQARICSDDGKGLGYARQMVVDHADGRYIIFVDGDVELLDDFVEKQVEFMEHNPKVGVTVGRYTYKEGRARALISTLWNLSHHVTFKGFLGNDATIYRCEAIRQVGGFDKNIKGACEDVDLIARIRAKGWIFRVSEKARFYHNSRDNLTDFWVEQNWFGYGKHYFAHKNKDRLTFWRNFPLAYFFFGLKTALRAYEFSREKKSFLLPLFFVFQKMGWWIGFIQSHLDGYGHEKS